MTERSFGCGHVRAVLRRLDALDLSAELDNATEVVVLSVPSQILEVLGVVQIVPLRVRHGIVRELGSRLGRDGVRRSIDAGHWERIVPIPAEIVTGFRDIDLQTDLDQAPRRDQSGAACSAHADTVNPV